MVRRSYVRGATVNLSARECVWQRKVPLPSSCFEVGAEGCLCLRLMEVEFYIHKFSVVELKNPLEHSYDRFLAGVMYLVTDAGYCLANWPIKAIC